MLAEILLSCTEDNYDVAFGLKTTLQVKYDFIVHLNVEKDSEEEDELLDAKIANATVLFLFEVGESTFSAWITIFGVDIEKSNYEQSSFPETIDFSDTSEGLEVLEDVLSTDFGLDVRPYCDSEDEDEQEEVENFSWWNLSEKEPRKSDYVAIVRSY